MCIPSRDREEFFEKGRSKGWSEDRIERAWAAHEGQRAKEDAKILVISPAPPRRPLAVGERVRWVGEGWCPSNGVGELLAIDGIEAWVRFEPGNRHTCSLRNLERTGERAGSNQANPYVAGKNW